MNAIDVHDVSFSYRATPVLERLSFSVEAGSFLSIAGPNGAGKSTLVNLLAAQLQPSQGSIRIGGQDLQQLSSRQLAGQMAIVRQEFVPAFGFTVRETVTMARTLHFDAMGFETRDDILKVRQAMELMDIQDLADRQLSQISGGERQRVFIARALAQDTPILLLDEPTSFLDIRHQVQIYDLLKKMQKETSTTILAVSHDINLAAQYADRVLLLGPDRTCLYGPPQEILRAEPIRRVFQVEVLEGQIAGTPFYLPIGKFTAKNRNQKT